VFLNGSRRGVLQALHLVDIHGTKLAELTFRLDGETELRRARIGTESVNGTPTAGDSITITFVMGVVTAVQRAADQ
jgi:hypothetical protein